MKDSKPGKVESWFNVYADLTLNRKTGKLNGFVTVRPIFLFVLPWTRYKITKSFSDDLPVETAQIHPIGFFTAEECGEVGSNPISDAVEDILKAIVDAAEEELTEILARPQPSPTRSRGKRIEFPDIYTIRYRTRLMARIGEIRRKRFARGIFLNGVPLSFYENLCILVALIFIPHTLVSPCGSILNFGPSRGRGGKEI